MKTIAALITVYNRKETTLNCLNNLYSQKLPEDCKLCVYLTDDGCTDGTGDAVGKQFPGVNIIKGDGSLYWNRGMWLAWDTASREHDFDWYFWLNDDTFLYNDALLLLLSRSFFYNDSSIIVGATESQDHSHSTYGGRINGMIPRIEGNDYCCETFNGNIVLVPKKVFLQIGNLDYYYRHSGGDIDYGLSASRKGIQIYQVGRYLGSCNDHSVVSDWCNESLPLYKRLIALNTPLGQSPQEVFHLERKFYPRYKAVFHFFTTYIHCIFPRLWRFVK